MKLTMERPQPRQREFMTAKNRFVAYGGARGGGKSWAVRKKAVLLALNYSGITILILRRTFPELRSNHINPMLNELGDAASYRELDKTIYFPNSSKIIFGYCDCDSDLRRYQGNEYDVIFLDEATHYPYEWFVALTACLRGANSFPKRFYLTCNPGGVGHEWVKRLFVDRNYKSSENPDDYLFIPARVYDNKALMDKDPEYVNMLKNLPDGLREAWLDGSWDVFAGQFFPEFDRDVHTLEPFEIPKHWRRYFAMDYGLDMLAGYWIAVDTHGRAYVYREIYEPNLVISEAAKRIKSLTCEEIHAWYAPPDLWNRRQETGRSVAEIFAQHGIPLVKASNNRVQGWLDVKEWLKPFKDEWGKPCAHLRIFKNCKNLIRCIPLLQHDEQNPNDAAVSPHDITHAPDAIRYFAAGRPIPADMPHIYDEDEPREYEEQVSGFLNFGI